MKKHRSLLMPFLDESHSFCHGFECGKIWELMSNQQPLNKYLIHAENKDQIKLMCDHFGYEYSIEEYDDTWSYLTASEIDISEIIKPS